MLPAAAAAGSSQPRRRLLQAPVAPDLDAPAVVVVAPPQLLRPPISQRTGNLTTFGGSSGASIGNVSTASNASSTRAVGSVLRPGEQCGGAGGLCNVTTIGFPCGDNVRGCSALLCAVHDCICCSKDSCLSLHVRRV